MCDINFNKKSECKSGYKVVAIDKDNNIYSIFTGQKYNIGNVELPPVKAEPITQWNSQLFYNELSQCGFYNKKYVGYTSVFTDFKQATRFFNMKMKNVLPKKSDFTLKLTKITFTGDTYDGNYMVSLIHPIANVIAGNYIESIKILD